MSKSPDEARPVDAGKLIPVDRLLQTLGEYDDRLRSGEDGPFPVYAGDEHTLIGHVYRREDGSTFLYRSFWSSFQVELSPRVALEVEKAHRQSGLSNDAFLAHVFDVYLKVFRAVRNGGRVEIVDPKNIEEPKVTIDRFVDHGAQ